MQMYGNAEKIEVMDILIGVCIVVCLVFCHYINRAGTIVDALAVTTSAIMCVQDNTRDAWHSSMTKLIGVFVGGVFGIAIVLIDSAVQIPMLFYVMCGMGVIATLVVCKFFRIIYVQARVAALTMLLVTMVFEGTDRMDYAMNRFIGSLVGALLALLISVVFSTVFRKKDAEQ